MFKTEKATKYYLVGRSSWSVTETFDNFEDLLVCLKYKAWRRKFESGWYWDSGQNREDWWEKQKYYLDVGNNRNDVCQYVVFDSDWRVVHRDLLYKEIEKIDDSNYRNFPWRPSCLPKRFAPWSDDNYLGHRNGPVPHVSHRGGAHCAMPKARQEIRESGQWLRPKRYKSLREALDWDHHKSRWYKSWKHCAKKRKQWE